MLFHVFEITNQLLTRHSLHLALGVNRELTQQDGWKTQAGVLTDLDPPRIGPPGPNPLAVHIPRSISASGFLPPSADLDPLTKLSKNITVHNFLT